MTKRSTRSAARSSSWADPLVSATDSVVRCQVSCPPTSATAAPRRPWIWALTDCTSLRLAFSEPASGKCRSTSRSATYASVNGSLCELALDRPRLEDLQVVALLDVLEVVQRDAALEAGGDLADVVVEAAQ